ncbi:DUF4134 domain-containing protein [Tenacibaculum finnmarkense]|uniref:DUF4134 domain-containing protein n=1 Tax=Tenacibaculum finnmarkense TaxID=2781243 RepID=UPI001EFA8295|nr:DUF4134 domain-containing protein [Tenacibaculum finnmarkense]MCG8226386.1 DUF4134 domain-containing protein [Tenacibaculum finnmarkense genomovar finnmarkense]
MNNNTNLSKKIFIALAFGITHFSSFAQSNGIDSASAELKTYVSSISNMILVIGAIVGLIGGVRVFVKWNNGDQDVNKAIMGWFGSCIFLVLVGGIIKAFFGI